MTLVWRPGFQFDVDASTYIEAVEAADTQALETGVRYAINDFVIGCKTDGIWSAIKASCILAGARTLTGALVPLVGTAPTNFNFVAGDYNRETGLVGDGSTKYLDSNRANNADPQNSQHTSVFATTADSTNRVYCGSGAVNVAKATIIAAPSSGSNTTRPRFQSRNATLIASLQVTHQAGLIGLSRASSANYQTRAGTQSENLNNVSSLPPSGNLHIFATDAAPKYHSNARIAFYSIGESLDLAALDTRVSNLITAIGAAIP